MLINDTLGGLLEKYAAETPDANFITYTGYNIRWSYADFNKRVDDFAKGLLELGVTKDSKVGIWANNVPDWLTVFFASAKIGAWLVTVNTNYKTSELEYLLKDSDIHTLCIIDHYRDSDYVGMLRELIPDAGDMRRIHNANLPYLRNVVLVDGTKRDNIYTSEDVIELGKNVVDWKYNDIKQIINCHDVVNMQYTSGTTGFPKGVMLTHHNIVNNGLATGDAMKYTAEDRLLVCVPLFHCFGIVLAVCAIITHGASMVITVDFDPLQVLKDVSAEKCTSLYGVPTMFVNELNHADFDKYDLSSLRTGIMAGSLCPIETMKQVMERMYMKEIISVYGLTETSPGMTCSRTYHTMRQRATTVGTEFPHVEVKIFNPETGAECGVGENGEICCRGYNVMRGYYKKPEATAEAIDKDGWLHSGDLAMKDEEGFYRITGRIKDMIIRGGENVYPREIENYIYQMPGVKMIEVVGSPDVKFGEIVVAFVIPLEGANLTEEAVREYCKGKIARYKIPKYVFFVDDYPKTGSGKVMKYKLREMAEKLVEERKKEEEAQK